MKLYLAVIFILTLLSARMLADSHKQAMACWNDGCQAFLFFDDPEKQQSRFIWLDNHFPKKFIEAVKLLDLNVIAPQRKSFAEARSANKDAQFAYYNDACLRNRK